MELKEIRKFGLIFGTASAGWGAWWSYRESQAAIYWLVASLLILLPALIYPLWLKPIYKFWQKLGEWLGMIITKIILITIFYLVLTPLGVILRLSGKQLLGTGEWLAHGRIDKVQYTKQY